VLTEEEVLIQETTVQWMAMIMMMIIINTDQSIKRVRTGQAGIDST
jgi:hypothetical protein